MCKNLINPVLFVLIVCMSFAQPVRTQSDALSLEHRKVSINIDKGPFRDVIRLLMVKYNVPIGFEESTADSFHSEFLFRTALPDSNDKSGFSYSNFAVKDRLFTVEFENAELTLVLDRLLQQMEGYSWSLNNGVVNIFPNTDRNKVFEELLGLKIGSFEIEAGTPVFEIRNKMIDLPEFASFMSKHDIKISRSRPFVRDMNRPITSSINLKDIGFREMLNQIIKLEGGGWILKVNKIDAEGAISYLYFEI